MPAPVISSIGIQQILINSNYRQTLQISNAPTSVRVLGMIYPFNYNWIPATGTLELLGNPTRTLSGTWTIQASNADGAAEAVEVQYAVIPLRPVINTDDLSEVTITRGQAFDKLVRVENGTGIRVEGELIGLDHGNPEDGETEGVRIFGTVPADANFTVRSGVFTITAPYPLGDVIGELPWQFPPGVSSPPLQLRANGAQGGGRVRLRWSAPSHDGGADILRYEYSRDGGARRSTGGTSLEFFDTGLTNLDTHTYQVFAVNRHGVSVGSNIVTVTVRISATVPTAPRDFAVSGRDGAAVGTWTASLDDGGDEITDYQYQRDGGTWQSAGLTGEFTDTGLNNGQTYRYKMRAVNGQGNSVETAEVSAIPRALPDAPTGLTATDLTDGEARLSWTAPANTGGLSILYYQYRIGTTGEWVSTGSTTTTHTISDLMGQSYDFYVRAITGVADETERYASEASSVATVTVTGPTASGPTAPRNFRIRTRNIESGGSVWSAFAWDAPTSPGIRESGTPSIVRYEYRTTNGGGQFASNNAWRSTGTIRQTEQIPFTDVSGSMIEVRAVNNNAAPNHEGDIASLTWDGDAWS